MLAYDSYNFLFPFTYSFSLIVKLPKQSHFLKVESSPKCNQQSRKGISVFCIAKCFFKNMTIKYLERRQILPDGELTAKYIAFSQQMTTNRDDLRGISGQSA